MPAVIGFSVTTSVSTVAKIDYSAANEYLDEQYHQGIPKPYFPPALKKEPVYNGRESIIYDNDNGNGKSDPQHLVLENPSLETFGVALRHLDAPRSGTSSTVGPTNENYGNYVPALKSYFASIYGTKIRPFRCTTPCLEEKNYLSIASNLAGHELSTSPPQSPHGQRLECVRLESSGRISAKAIIRLF